MKKTYIKGYIGGKHWWSFSKEIFEEVKILGKTKRRYNISLDSEIAAYAIINFYLVETKDGTKAEVPSTHLFIKLS